MRNKLEQKLNELERKLDDGLNELKKLKAKLEAEKLAGLKIGDTFELIGKKWKILDSNENDMLCICMESLGDKTFDSECNKWTSSNLRNYLNTEIYKKICEEIGEENVIEFERNLLSLDGQTEYGACKDFVSLISIDEYRTYRSLIPNFDEWWWMLSPYSTKCNEDSSYVSVVSPVGDINNRNYNNSNGVRPFCITDSRSRQQAETRERDTKRCMTFPKWVNTKEFMKWTRTLLRILKICTALIKKRNLVKVIMEVVQDFKI